MQDSAVPTFTANTRLVLVDVIPEYTRAELYTQAVAPATGVKKEDFRVFDNGREMPISSFDVGAEHNTRPIALWLIVQCPEGRLSGRASDFLLGKTRLINPALTHLDPQDVVAVAHWCDNGDALIDLPPGHDPEAALTTLDELLAQSPTQGENRKGELAMQKLIRLLIDDVQHQKPDRLPVLLFFYGDACATYPDEAEKIIEAVLETSGIVFGMSDGSWQIKPAAKHNHKGQVNYLVHLYSRETGGRFYTITDAMLFSATADHIVSQLHSRYTLGFRPLAIDGKTHELKVELTKEANARFHRVRLRFRQAYVPIAGASGN